MILGALFDFLFIKTLQRHPKDLKFDTLEKYFIHLESYKVVDKRLEISGLIGFFLRDI